MSAGGNVDVQAKRALYWLGDQLIEHRNTISILVLAITGVFLYWTMQLKLETSFGELLPQTHPFVQTHNKYAPTFGGANNIMVMVQVRDGTIFTPEHLSRIFRMTEGLDRVYGINHNQIDSIGHRTTRYLKVGAAGVMRSQPVMLGPAKNDAEAADARTEQERRLDAALAELPLDTVLVETQQARKLDYAPPFQFGHPAAFQLAERIVSHMPAGLDRVFFCGSGSEAADTSLKIARAYWRLKGQAGKTRFIGFRRATVAMKSSPVNPNWARSASAFGLHGGSIQ